MRRRRFWRWGFVFISLFGGVAFWLWRRAVTATPARFAVAEREILTIAVRETGTIEPLIEVAVKSKVAGRLLALKVDEGDIVRKGQVIALLDPTELQRQVNQVKAALAAAEARLREAKVSLRVQGALLKQQWEQAKADYEAAQANLQKLRERWKREVKVAEAEVKKALANLELAEREWKRQKELGALNIIALRQAEAELEVARARWQKLKSGGRPEEVTAAEAELKQAKALLEEAKRDLERQKHLVAYGVLRRRAEAEVKAAEAELERAKRAWERQRRLYEKGFVSKQQVDDAEVAYRAAQARLEQAKATLRQAIEDERQALASARARYERALQGVKAAQARLALLKTARPEDLKAAEAQVARAKALFLSARATEQQSIEVAEARYKAALQDYRAARERWKILKATLIEDLKAAEAQVRRTFTALKMAKARMKEKEALLEGVKAAEAEVRRLREQLANLQVQLQETVIKAPLSGIVIHKGAEVGEFVTSAISGFSEGTEIITIADMSKLIVRIRLNEVDVTRVHVGQEAEVRVDALPEKVFTGTVTKIAPAAFHRSRRRLSPSEPLGEPEVAWFEVEVLLKETHPFLRPGMSARVDIIGRRIVNALTLLANAILTDEDGSHYVLRVIDPQIAEVARKALLAGRLDELKIPRSKVPTRKVKVQIGVSNEVKVQIVAGLKSGDVVLVNPPKRRRFPMGPPREEGEEE